MYIFVLRYGVRRASWSVGIRIVMMGREEEEEDRDEAMKKSDEEDMKM